MDLVSIQKMINESRYDGWLLYDFRRSNDLACRFLELSPEVLLTRRFFYWIPLSGQPVKLVSIIEPHHLDHLPGEKRIYRSWQELGKILHDVLEGSRRIAMEYSPMSGNPYVSKVDAGTVEMVRACGVEIGSSGDLIQQATSVWDDQQWHLHLEAAETLDEIVASAWRWIAEGARTDYAVQQFILEQLAKRSCVTEGQPICAVNEDSADPHFAPSQEKARPIRSGDFVLIDLWCKRDMPRATYADICRVGVMASRPSEKQQRIFLCVKQARDIATEFVRQRFGEGVPVMGWEVDQVARDVIHRAGYGDYFTHRTGHNIGEKDHGDGAHLDNLETQDSRQLLPRTCFSIEPGIYLPGELGVRLEYDVFVHSDRTIQVTGGVQEELVCLLR